MDNYSFLQKTLHKISLGNKLIKKSLFEIEKNFFLKKENFIYNNHIFITGLPRSGTTSLLNFFYLSDDYASPTYNDMPFILSPNLFSKFSFNKKIKKKERIHNDGIQYDQDSPDSFDEVLFLTFDESEIIHNYVNFISLILNKYNKTKYLSKNNYNYKRTEQIISKFPNSSILIPFRDPLQHANSLISQHFLFSEKQNSDHFILEYMNFLGHFEFGINHKSWFKPVKYNNFNEINYWIEQWYLFYSRLEKKNLNKNLNIFFINYENLCKNKTSKEILLKKFNFNEKNEFSFIFSEKEIKYIYDKNLLNKCNEVYKKLSNSSLI